MPNDDAVIAKALNAGLRRLLVTAFEHEKDLEAGIPRTGDLQAALRREIDRLVIRGTTEGGDDVELTKAVRQALNLFVDAAHRQASTRGNAPDQMQ
jgi:hypothetical protein